MKRPKKKEGKLFKKKSSKADQEENLRQKNTPGKEQMNLGWKDPSPGLVSWRGAIQGGGEKKGKSEPGRPARDEKGEPCGKSAREGRAQGLKLETLES